MKFLRTFQSHYDLSEVGKLEHWQSDLGAHPKAVIEGFLQSGLLEKTAPNVRELLSLEASKTLKELANARELPASGTKADLAKRLVEADPEGMVSLFKGKTFVRCSPEGRKLVDDFRKAEAEWEKNATAECLAALRQHDFEKASRASSRSGNADHRDCRVLQLIFSAHLARHANLDEKQISNIRVAAAMMQLWGTNNATPYLEEGLSVMDFDWNVESRMLLFRALGTVRLEEIKELGIGRVQVLASGTSEDCPVCAADNNKVYDIGAAPILPHDGCACEGGCPCTLVAAL